MHCGDFLIETLHVAISEIKSILNNIEWNSEFSIKIDNHEFTNQRAYNKAFEQEFNARGWELQPKLNESPKLIGDFRKNLVFVEVQFGNSSTLYRDFYKFQYGLQNGLLSLAVLIVPYNENEFFPTRRESVINMANYILAERYFSVLPISVPTWLIGLLPES
ncbi:MAG TPA: BglII/BstYI family type II restriction endonuclease [Desulfobacteraceae bacterium]|nr:BglII/BstYI family type II restriction endonuclease [Desulfobacteraceae bacterium]